MKARRWIGWLVVAGLLAGAMVMRAQGGPPPWAGQGAGPRAGHGAADEEFSALERFLTMSDAELDEMQQAIARVRAMRPEERARLRSEIEAFRRMAPEHRDEIRGGWGWKDARDREDWRTMMHEKTPEERAAIQAELQRLSPAQRVERKHALLDAWRAARTETVPARP